MAVQDRRAIKWIGIICAALAVLIVTAVVALFVLSPSNRGRGAVVALVEQPGHGHLYHFHGMQTRFEPNPTFDRVVGHGERALPYLIEHLESGQLDRGQVAVFDLALWRIATGRPKEQLAVLGSYQRPVGPGDEQAVVRAWGKWTDRGYPLVTRGGAPFPDLRDYPKLDQVLR